MASVAVTGYVMICLAFAGSVSCDEPVGGFTRWDESVNRWFAENRTDALNSWTNDATRSPTPPASSSHSW
jgi:hypothetical protein